MLCITETTDTSKWNRATIKNRAFYFCRRECWEQWLEHPNYMGCYSPVIETDSEVDIPDLNLTESAQPLKSRGGPF